MRIYTKVHAETKRQAIGRLSWGAMAATPGHLVQFPGRPAPAQQGPQEPQKRAARG